MSLKNLWKRFVAAGANVAPEPVKPEPVIRPEVRYILQLLWELPRWTQVETDKQYTTILKGPCDIEIEEFLYRGRSLTVKVAGERLVLMYDEHNAICDAVKMWGDWHQQRLQNAIEAEEAVRFQRISKHLRVCSANV